MRSSPQTTDYGLQPTEISQIVKRDQISDGPSRELGSMMVVARHLFSLRPPPHLHRHHSVRVQVRARCLAALRTRTTNKKKEAEAEAKATERLTRRTRSESEFDWDLYRRHAGGGGCGGGSHVPVMLGEVLQAFRGLRLRSFVDCTLGAAGHSSAVRLPLPLLCSLPCSCACLFLLFFCRLVAEF